jgi:hypothetical protein
MFLLCSNDGSSDYRNSGEDSMCHMSEDAEDGLGAAVLGLTLA